MNLSEVKKVVGRIKGHIFKNSNSFSVGMLKSHFKGSGLQFREHQIYVYGDEVRFIDWKLLAKTNTPYIKTFDEERNVEIVAVIDAGPSMLSGHDNISKLQVAIEIACLLYLLASETGDKVHCVVVDDKVHHIPPLSGDKGIATFVSMLERLEILNKNGDINIARNLRKHGPSEDRTSWILKHLKRRHEVVLLSDFHEFLEYKTIVNIIKRTNVHGFRIITPLDEAQKLPYMIPSFDNLVRPKLKLRKVVMSGRKSIDSLFNGKLRTIRVHDHYLENFVKEMV